MDIKEMLRKSWKYITAFTVCAVVMGIFISRVTASNEPIISLVGDDTQALETDEILDLSANITIPNYPDDVDALVATNLVWESENNQVVILSKDFATEIPSEKVIGNNIQAKAIKAGRTSISVKFYYKLGDDGVVRNEVYDPTDTSFQFVEVKYSSFITKFSATFDPVDAYSSTRVYEPGEQLTFRANTYSADPVMVTSSNVVAEGVAVSDSEGKIVVKKGGKGIVVLRPVSGYVPESNTYLNELCSYHTIVGAIHFTDPGINSSGLYEMQAMDYGLRLIESNIDTSENAGMTYESSDPLVATMAKSTITPKGAGYATITAGVKGENDEYMTYTNELGELVKAYDTVDVLIPFVWTNESIPSDTMTQNINVGDYFQLYTNATESSLVTYASSNNSVATVSDTGYITAKESGTTTITATVKNGEYTGTISATINVGDIFTLNAANVSLGVNESYDISAIGSATAANITFTIDGVEASSATGGLTGVVNSNVLTVTGHNEGTYTVQAKMEYNGMIKNATCIVTVKTQVSDITIMPTTLDMNVGDTANLSVTVGPNTAYNKNVVWVSSDSNVVSVDTDTATAFGAIITANKGGFATITVVSVSDGTKYATCTVNVHDAVTGLEISETSVEVNKNITPEYYLSAKVLPENTTGLADGINRQVVWSSTDESVLKVEASSDTSCKVTFMGAGSAAVVAKTVDGGYTAYCNFVVAVPVESVEISSEDLIMNVGDTQVLTAEVLPLTATNRTVKWSTTDTNVVTIDSNGKLKAVGAGHAAVLCSSLDNSVQDYINVYVRQPVSNIKLNTNKITVSKGTEFWLYATILPETADIKEVDWSSSDTTLATVSRDGKVTALAPGVVTIMATSKDNGGTDYCVVTIEEAVQSISLLTGDSQTLFVGAQFTIVPEILPIDAPNKAVTYVSTNPEIATVDANGCVIGLMGGECDIIVTTVERELKALCHITVKEYLSTIELDKSFSYLNVGSYIDLIATTTTDTASNKNIMWLTSNSGIATVDPTGRVTGVDYGSVVITAIAEDGGGAMAKCVIQVIEPVTRITLSATELKMIQGDTYIVNATVDPNNATVKTLKWETTDANVATVDSDGEITAVAGGKCRIYARSTDGNDVFAYCTVYVTNITNATSIALNSSSITIDIGEQRQLKALTTPSVITEKLEWSSSDTGIVTVDQDGNIRGIAQGTAVVSVRGLDGGARGTCTVNVRSSIISATSITINSSDIIMLTGKTRQLVTRLYPSNSNEAIKWYSSDTSVVVVDDSGKITTVGPGQATVTAVTQTTGLTSSCVVHAIALSRTSVTLQQYDPFMLYVDVPPSKISWRTNNPRIATVSSTGEVIGRKPGTTTITATIDGKTLTCTVTITEATKY